VDLRQRALIPATAPAARRAVLATVAIAALVLFAMALGAPALAATPAPAQPPVPGAAAEVDAARAIEIARIDPVAIDQAAKNPDLTRRARLDDSNWEVGLYSGGEQVGLVIVDSDSGEIEEAWAGHQVEWRMARGYEGAFGRALNAPYVFLPLCALFLLGLVDWRRPLRLANLDLVVLLGFGVSHIFFNRAEIGLSVPLAYPVLIYLLARLAWIGTRGRAGARARVTSRRRGRPSGATGATRAVPPAGLRPVWPTAWLILAVLFLVGFRVGLNVVNSGVADIGYASVVGADRLSSGESLYGNFPSDVAQGDTYGPLTYLTYIPFELVFPWQGEWDRLPAAHAAALAFDLGTIALLFLLGRRVRPGPDGRRLGAILAFGWAAYPYTAFNLVSNSNDGLVALLLVAALALGARPAARGAVTAMAALAKFAPLVAVPILARQSPGSDFGSDPPAGPSPATGALRRLATGVLRRLAAAPPARFVAGFTALAALVTLPFLLDSGLATVYERTVGYQAGRDSPFSIWGQVTGLAPLRYALAAVLAVAILATLRYPRRPGTVQTAALAGALLIGTQLLASHWFYLYIVWFYPAVLVAFAADRPERSPAHSFAGAFDRASLTPVPPAASPVRSSSPARPDRSRPAPP